MNEAAKPTPIKALAATNLGSSEERCASGLMMVEKGSCEDFDRVTLRVVKNAKDPLQTRPEKLTFRFTTPNKAL
jgi:hypothetical protein